MFSRAARGASCLLISSRSFQADALKLQLDPPETNLENPGVLHHMGQPFTFLGYDAKAVIEHLFMLKFSFAELWPSP